MASAAQVKRLVAPFVRQHNELIYCQRMLVLKPLNHVLRAVRLGRASDPRMVAVGTVVLPVYHPGFRHISWGWGISRPDGWSYAIDQPDAQDLLIAELDHRALPRLAAIHDIAGMKTYIEAHEFRHHFEFGSHLSTAAALGDFDDARRICRELEAKGSLEGPGGDAESTGYIEDLRVLCELICRDDRAAVIKLLHQREAATAARWGLADIWEPSPFPLETQGGG